MDLFAKKSAIRNAKILFKIYKQHIRGNWSQSKNETNLFEADENANLEKNDETIIDSDYNSDNM